MQLSAHPMGEGTGMENVNNGTSVRNQVLEIEKNIAKVMVGCENVTRLLMPALWNGSEVLDGNALDAFETEVGDIIQGMLDPDAPFAATPSANACKYCAAKAFCPVKVESNW